MADRRGIFSTPSIIIPAPVVVKSGFVAGKIVKSESAANSFAAAAAATGTLPVPFGQYAVDFPGGGSNVKYLAATIQPSNPDNTWAWTGWINPDTVSGRQSIANFWQGAQVGWFIELNGNVVRVFFDSGARIYSTTLTVSASVWRFLAVVWNNGTWTIYLGDDGSDNLQSNTSSPGAYSSAYTSAVYSLGGDALTFATGEFNGKMSECGYWDKALTLSDIQTIYNAGAGATYDDFSGSFITNSELKTYHQCIESGAPILDAHGSSDLSETGTGTITYQAAGPGV